MDLYIWLSPWIEIKIGPTIEISGKCALFSTTISYTDFLKGNIVPEVGA